MDEEDVSGLVQTSLNLVKQDTKEEKWHRLMARLQTELAGQPQQARGHHVNNLLGRLRCLGPVAEDSPAAQLQALLLAMSEPDLSGGSSGNDGSDCWMVQWVNHLCEHLPDLQEGTVAGANDSVDEEALIAAAEEAEAKLAGGRPTDHHSVAEFYYMREQERAVLQHQAANYRDWETWEAMDRKDSVAPRLPW